MSLPKQWADEIDTYKNNVGKKLNLTRYTSTSKSKDVAIQFATKDASDQKVPLIFCYFLAKGSKSGHKFLMNSALYSAYPEEEELLLDDGHEFTVRKVEENQVFNNLPCTIVTFDIEGASKAKV